MSSVYSQACFSGIRLANFILSDPKIMFMSQIIMPVIHELNSHVVGY